MNLLRRLDAARAASGAAALLALMTLVAFVNAALQGGVHRAGWVAAAALLAMVSAGLLYASRLGAYGDAR